MTVYSPPRAVRWAAALGVLAISAACSSEQLEKPQEETLDPPESQPRYDGFVGAQSHGIAVAQVNIDQLTRSAAQIFHGKVISKNEETIAIGGSNAPVVRYRFAVDSTLKGTTGSEFEMVTIKSPLDSRGKPLLEGLPRFELNATYVVFAGAPSKLGLSAPIGLSQGVFHVRGAGNNRHLVNDHNNRGLFRGINDSRTEGPIAFDALTSRVNALLRSKENSNG